MHEQQRGLDAGPLQRSARTLEAGGGIVGREAREYVLLEQRSAVNLSRRRLGAGLEALPHAVDGRQSDAQVVGQQQVLRDDLEIGLERAQPVERARPRVAAQPLRAEVRDRLDDRELVAALEQHEQALRMVARRRQRILLRQLTGQLRRYGSCREIVDCGRVAVPGRLARKARQVGEQLGVDFPARVRERALGQLVEHDLDDRHRRARRPRYARAVVAGQHEAPHRRADEEEEQHDQRRRRQHRHERAHCGRARVEQRGTRAEGQRDRNRGAGASEYVPGRRQQQRPDDQRDQYEHRRPPQRRLDPPERPDHPRAGQRRHERVSEGEQQDVARCAPVRDEELGIAPEQVEQRLRERERPQAAEMQRGQREADPPARARVRADQSVRVSDSGAALSVAGPARARPRRQSAGG